MFCKVLWSISTFDKLHTFYGNVLYHCCLLFIWQKQFSLMFPLMFSRNVDSIKEGDRVRRNGTLHHMHFGHPDSFISLTAFLSGMVFRSIVFICDICVPVSAHGSKVIDMHTGKSTRSTPFTNVSRMCGICSPTFTKTEFRKLLIFWKKS